MAEADFEFREVTEEEEKLDYSKLVNCPHCKKPIPHDATMCLYCGDTVELKDKKSGWLAVATVLLIIVFIVFFIVYM